MVDCFIRVSDSSIRVSPYLISSVDNISQNNSGSLECFCPHCYLAFYL